jgi:hypothetical protein
MTAPGRNHWTATRVGTVPMRPAKPYRAEQFGTFHKPTRRSSSRDTIRWSSPGVSNLLAATQANSQESGVTMERLIVDTSTMQTKAVAYPTDGQLILRAIERLGALARRQGFVLSQSLLCVARHARREAARLLHGCGDKQGMRHLRRRRTFPS